MAFVVTTRVPSTPATAVRRTSRRMAGRLRHRLEAPLEMTPRQRAERYVAHMPTAVLGAC